MDPLCIRRDTLKLYGCYTNGEQISGFEWYCTTLRRHPDQPQLLETGRLIEEATSEPPHKHSIGVADASLTKKALQSQ